MVPRARRNPAASGGVPGSSRTRLGRQVASDHVRGDDARRDGDPQTSVGSPPCAWGRRAAWLDWAEPCLVHPHGGEPAGYVGPAGHPAYGLSHEDKRLAEVSVHGGVRFSGPGAENSELAPGYWWFGWQCGHDGDSRPWLDPSSRVYRDARFARAGPEYLARQLAKMAGVTVDPAMHPERLR